MPAPYFPACERVGKRAQHRVPWRTLIRWVYRPVSTQRRILWTTRASSGNVASTNGMPHNRGFEQTAIVSVPNPVRYEHTIK
jgi:hypothetical protein